MEDGKLENGGILILKMLKILIQTVGYFEKV